MKRNSLIYKALVFLRQAPNQTDAYSVGWGLIVQFVQYKYVQNIHTSCRLIKIPGGAGGNPFKSFSLYINKSYIGLMPHRFYAISHAHSIAWHHHAYQRLFTPKNVSLSDC